MGALYYIGLFENGPGNASSPAHPRSPDHKLECLPQARLNPKGFEAYFLSVRDERRPTQTE